MTIMKENIVNRIESMIIYDVFNNNYKYQKKKMKKNYKAFLMASTVFLTFPLTSYSSIVVSDSRDSRGSYKKQHSITRIICPLERGILNYKIGVSRLSQESSLNKKRNIGKESDSSDEQEYPQNYLEALKYFRDAAQSFESQFLSNGKIDHDKFQGIYEGQKGNHLFYYGQVLKYIEFLTAEKEERRASLNKLFDVVIELSYKKERYAITPPLKEGQGEGNILFSSLGYAHRFQAQKLSVSIDQLFLDDPKFMLFSIDLQRKWLAAPSHDFEEFFINLLAKWEPSFTQDTIKKLDEIG